VPLKRALGTSLVAVVVLVIPGTIVHAVLGNIEWAAAVFLMIGSLPARAWERRSPWAPMSARSA
jgi:uncharacterized membrane protein YfcA